MDPNHAVQEQVRKALMSEPRVDLHAFPIRLDFDQGTLKMQGEVANVAAKKLALEAAGAVPGVTGIVDRLTVKPAEAMGDRQIRDHFRDALYGEPALADCHLVAVYRGSPTVLRRPAEPIGRVEYEIDEGILTLNGTLPTLARKRLVGVLAWWIPGSLDVINGIAVEPPEKDNVEALEDAVRVVLEKDPFVNASQIRVGVRETTVRLTGLVPSEAERDMAEFDAWYVFGVDAVINEIEVG